MLKNLDISSNIHNFAVYRIEYRPPSSVQGKFLDEDVLVFECSRRCQRVTFSLMKRVGDGDIP